MQLFICCVKMETLKSGEYDGSWIYTVLADCLNVRHDDDGIHDV
jgi:hypothetical protein